MRDRLGLRDGDDGALSWIGWGACKASTDIIDQRADSLAFATIVEQMLGAKLDEPWLSPVKPLVVKGRDERPHNRPDFETLAKALRAASDRKPCTGPCGKLFLTSVMDLGPNGYLCTACAGNVQNLGLSDQDLQAASKQHLKLLGRGVLYFLLANAGFAAFLYILFSVFGSPESRVQQAGPNSGNQWMGYVYLGLVARPGYMIIANTAGLWRTRRGLFVKK